MYLILAGLKSNMPHARNRNPSPIPEGTWDTGLKEMNETWKGAIACLGVAVFFVMTIGIIYWQVVDQPNKNWILRGTFSGLIWERRTQSLVIQTLDEDKTFVEIDVGNVGSPDTEVPFVRNLCWLNKTEFCYTWESVAEVKISLEVSGETECYGMSWTPASCHVVLKVGLQRGSTDCTALHCTTLHTAHCNHSNEVSVFGC